MTFSDIRSSFGGMPDLASRARTLLDLHTAPEILVLANVWDVVSARVVAATDGVRALATASHSIAATFGYEDGAVGDDGAVAHVHGPGSLTCSRAGGRVPGGHRRHFQQVSLT